MAMTTNNSINVNPRRPERIIWQEPVFMFFQTKTVTHIGR